MFNDIIKILNLEYLKDRILTIETTSTPMELTYHIVLKKGDHNCVRCSDSNVKIHSYRDKTITHSISTNHKCYIKYKARRYQCRTCLKVFYEHNPFSAKHHKISVYTKLAILEQLKSHTQTYSSIAKQFNISTQSVINIFDDHVEAKRRRLPKVICIDEFFKSKGSKYKYALLMYDFTENKVIDVLTTRHKYYVNEQLLRIPIAEKDNVEIFIIDMWTTYRDIIKERFPKAKIAVDSFHVIRTLNEHIKRIRIDIMNKYYKQSSQLIHNDMYYYMLKKFSYFFVKNYEDIYNGYILIPKLQAKWHKSTIRDYLLNIDDDLKAAYLLKEKYRLFNLTADYETCDEKLTELIYEFRNDKQPLFRAFGRMISTWKTEIKNSFIKVDGRRVSNGPIEGANSRIKTLIKTANGFKNFHRTRNRIMYCLNQDIPIKLIK